jgi:hypothetical protein
MNALSGGWICEEEVARVGGSLVSKGRRRGRGGVITGVVNQSNGNPNN